MKMKKGQVNNEAIRTEIVVPGHGMATTYPGPALSEVANLVKICVQDSGHIKHYSRVH